MTETIIRSFYEQLEDTISSVKKLKPLTASYLHSKEHKIIKHETNHNKTHLANQLISIFDEIYDRMVREVIQYNEQLTEIQTQIKGMKLDEVAKNATEQEKQKIEELVPKREEYLLNIQKAQERKQAGKAEKYTLELENLLKYESMAVQLIVGAYSSIRQISEFADKLKEKHLKQQKLLCDSFGLKFDKEVNYDKRLHAKKRSNAKRYSYY